MSQAVRDLPDPMEPPPALAASSPDDLLAKMADEAIDKLMAEADKGATPAAAAPPPPIEVNETPATPAAEPEAGSMDAALSAAEQAVADLLNPPEEPVAATPVAEPAVAPATPAVETNIAQPAAAAEFPPPPAADVQALLQEAPPRSSPLLLPLQIINSPFSFLSDRARRALGLIGLVTLVPAICAIAYVIYFKHHW